MNTTFCMGKPYKKWRPSSINIIRTLLRFMELFRSGRTSTATIPSPGGTNKITTIEMINKIHDIVLNDLKVKVHEIAETVSISTERLVNILHTHLYRVSHLTFGIWISYKKKLMDIFLKVWYFSVHFRLFGQKVNKVNKQNCRIWGPENPKAIIEKPMHPKRVTVWCGFWYGGIIGPFFFQNEQRAAITVNGERYRAMLEEFLFPKIEEDGMDDIWFQQDGSTWHTANVTIDLLRTVFEKRIISRNSDVNWAHRSNKGLSARKRVEVLSTFQTEAKIFFSKKR